MPDGSFDNGGSTLDAANLKIRKFSPKVPIHGFMINESSYSGKTILVALETSDNQIDTNVFDIKNFANDETVKVSWL